MEKKDVPVLEIISITEVGVRQLLAKLDPRKPVALTKSAQGY